MKNDITHRSVFLTTLMLIFLLTNSSLHAVTLGFVEDFTTTQYKDTLNTTVLWDTVAGELKLPPYQPSIVGTYDTPSEARYVTISGDYAYVADLFSGLLVIDISDRTSPALAGIYDTPGEAVAVAISGDYAYVADWDMGLQVIDISDPTSPALAGTYDTPSEAHGVAISGDYAYVANRYDGLLVIDISDPTNPALVGSHTTWDRAYDVAVSGDYAYVADYEGGLAVFNISDPETVTVAGHYDTSGQSWSLAVSGDYAYVADRAAGLQVIDISDPTTPTLAGSYDTPWSANGVVISGDRAYVADGGAGLQVVDISDPTNPALVGSLDTPGNGQGIALSGDHAYLADYTSGLQVIRIAEPVLPPEPAGNSDTTLEMHPIVLAGDYAYAGAGVGVFVFDITDPTSPTQAGSYTTPGGLRDIALDGDHLYVADGNGGFRVLDVSDPTSPVSVGALSVGWAKYVTVQGDYAYVGVDYTSNGFKVIDISDPTNPVLVGNPPFSALPIACDGDYAYIGYGDFKTVDISDPTSPVIVATCVTPSHEVSGITIAGDYAFVGDYASGLQVIDISDPTNPVIAGSYDTPGGAQAIAISGDLAFVADGSGFVQLIDISDPATPTLAATCTTPGNAYAVAVAGDFMYATNFVSGVAVAQVFQRAMTLADNTGQSTDVSPYAGDILEARLTTTQNDTITWEMSADGGGNWQPVLPDGSWNQLGVSGDVFRWRSSHRPVNARTNPACTSLQFDFMFEYPQVDVIEDIANDQGRQVSISWLRSGNDYVGSGTPITEYAIYREVDPALAASQALLERGDESFDPRYRAGGDPMMESLPPGSWHFIMTVPALAEDNYAAVVPTLADSTISDGMYYSTFIVLALTATPGVYFESPPDSGYSIDNLAPNVPQGFSVAYNSVGGNHLSWESAPEEDFRYCCIYRSTSPDFTPASANLVQTTVGGEWLDPVSEGWQYYYKISAVDFSGNESDPATPETATGITGSVIPKTFGLYPNVPNPFNPTTSIRYDVPPGGGAVTLRIYDVGGRLVRTLVDGPQTAGQKATAWNGRDNQGRSVASGVYFYRLQAPGYEKTMKMVLVQ